MANFEEPGEPRGARGATDSTGARDDETATAGTPTETPIETVEQQEASGHPRLKEPPKFAVVLHNDDYTTMEFVIEVLQRYFRRTIEEANRIMLSVHQQGKGVAGIYPFDIAETKAMQVIEHARSRGFPLMCTVEPSE